MKQIQITLTAEEASQVLIATEDRIDHLRQRIETPNSNKFESDRNAVWLWKCEVIYKRISTELFK